MKSNKLSNYLRAYRRRAGLSQREVAFLLGAKSRDKVSEIEKRHRMPLLRTALALEAIFGIPAGELFAGMRESIASEIDERLHELASEISTKVGSKKKTEYQSARKLAWLRTRRGSVPIHERTAQARARA